MLKLFVNVTKLLSETMVFFYAVARGRNPGIYHTWEECKAEVNKFPNPKYKKFPSKSEAESFVKSEGGSGLRIKLTEGMCIANMDNYRPDIAAPKTKPSLINPPYNELEKRLKLWAQKKRQFSHLNVQAEASRVAKELGIENFNSSGGWLKHHLECNPEIYKSLRAQKPAGEISDSDCRSENQNTNLVQKLSRLECRITGIPTTGGSIPARIKLLEQTLHSMHQELHDIKRHFSTVSSEDRHVPDSSNRKRKKMRGSSEDEDSDNSSRTKNNSVAPGEFHTDAEGFVHVYTDGACSSNGRSGAAAGIGVWFGQDHPLNVSRPVAKGCRATNNLAEIQAVTVAAEQASRAGIKKLKINTDSQFLISCITQWMPKWKKNGWKKADGDKVINKDELIEMERALKPLTIAWNHVRGHAGVHGNEMADQLARAGAAAQRKI